MPHEEVRKILRIGNSFAVTIPKGWLRYFNLTNGDRVKVVSNTAITIKPPFEKAMEESRKDE